ncbi:hypothetical protein PYCC9005_004550 [Savitreella phatthalungensis]
MTTQIEVIDIPSDDSADDDFLAVISDDEVGNGAAASSTAGPSDLADLTGEASVGEGSGGKRPAPADPRLSHLSCVICLDTPTDLTATVCGHLFCHACITAALESSAQQLQIAHSTPSHRNPSGSVGVCPVCRRRVKLSQLVPLSILRKDLMDAREARARALVEQQAENAAAATASRARGKRTRPAAAAKTDGDDGVDVAGGPADTSTSRAKRTRTPRAGNPPSPEIIRTRQRRQTTSPDLPVD